MSRNQLSNTNSNQENSKRVHIFIVGALLPSENGSSSCLMSPLQLVDLEIKSKIEGGSERNLVETEIGATIHLYKNKAQRNCLNV